MRNIIIADNQDISNAGWHYVLNNQSDVSDIHDVSEKKELLSLLALFPDSLVILDYTLFDFESVNELVILEGRFEKVDWILFSDELSDEFLRILLYNTHSYSVLMKDCTKEEIRSAIKETFKGYRYICNHVSNLLLDNSKNMHNLNARQILTNT